VHANAQRVQDALRAAGSPAQVVELAESTRTSVEAAAAIGVEQGQIAKSLLFLVDGAPVLAILSGVDRLDTERLRAEVGGSVVTRPDAAQVRELTGFPIGGVSPLAVPASVRVLLDRGLESFDVVWAAAGTPHAVFPTSFGELAALTGAEIADVRVRTED
jgi:prolyl-tRNA editing enzyme YbaK/EbsC (Cys-tRNA(Pro) deacylase)